jgi:hypothetical protein
VKFSRSSLLGLDEEQAFTPSQYSNLVERRRHDLSALDPKVTPMVLH